MLKYLIIQLSDSATSFCHYQAGGSNNLMSIGTLSSGIIWAMKQNVSVQVVFPDVQLNEEYPKILDTVDHVKIVSASCQDPDLIACADVIVINHLDSDAIVKANTEASYVVRAGIDELLRNTLIISDLLQKVKRLNIVITDVPELSGQKLEVYQQWLTSLSSGVKKEYLRGHFVQFNLLTDCFMLDKMNNCNAGCDSVTLAPDGRFYVCPAFYFDAENYGLGEGHYSIGDVEHGVDIKNSQLYQLDHAPLCRMCEAYQCKRCVWLNRKMTYEVNTPSHEQCVMAHLERNASRSLLMQIQENIPFLTDKVIDEIEYLDPFEVYKIR